MKRTPSETACEDAVGLHWIPIPARGDLVGGALVPAVRVVLPGSRRELLVERGIEVDHVTLYRGVQRFTPLLIDAARPVRHLAGDRWFLDETYVKVSGVWSYVYRRSTSVAR